MNAGLEPSAPVAAVTLLETGRDMDGAASTTNGGAGADQASAAALADAP